MKRRVKTKYHLQKENLFGSFEPTEPVVSAGGSIVCDIGVDLTFRNERTQYLTHGFHSYPAKFIPQLPTWLMKNYSKDGGTILDPFVGSGTTLVEALLNSRNGLGVEINPIGRLTSQAKSTPILPMQIKSSKDDLYKGIASLAAKYLHGTTLSIDFGSPKKFDLWMPYFENFHKWFLPEVAKELAVIRKAIYDVANQDFRVLALVAFSSIVKSVSNARTEERNPKLRKEQRIKPDTIKIFKKKLDKMAIDLTEFTAKIKEKKVTAKVIGEDARHLPIGNDSIDMIITSPPYAYAMDYVRMHKLSLYWLGEGDLAELDRKFVGTERVYSEVYKNEFSFDDPFIDEFIQKIKSKSRKKAYIVYKYFVDMQKCFIEMYRVLKSGGTAAIVIGNSTVQKVTIPTHICFDAIAKSTGFDVKQALERSVPSESKGLANVHVEYGGEMVQKEYINLFVK
jgi:DNA modification methylase